jgi:hypothetical protein
MLRWLGILLALAIASPADAQVFKPKSKKSAKADKSEKAEKPDKDDKAEPQKKAKKQPRSAQTKKRVKKKKNAADRARPDDLTPEPEKKGADKDYVKIWEDDEIE